MFPTQSPELNPIEMSWNAFVKRLVMKRLIVMAGGGSDSTTKAVASLSLSEFNHNDICKTYVKYGYIRK